MMVKKWSINLLIGILTFTYFLMSSLSVRKNESKDIVFNAFKSWQEGTGNFFDILSDKVEWRVAGSGIFSGTYSGKDEFLEKAVKPINNQLASKIKPELIDILAEGETVWLHWKGTATTKTGVIYQNEYVWKLQFKEGMVVKVHAFLDTSLLDKLFTNKIKMQTIEDTKEYIGMWVTKDGYIRHELLPNNRYDEARGNRKSAYQGNYKVIKNHIYYKDDTGFTADGEFKDGILYHAGMILYKENK